MHKLNQLVNDLTVLDRITYIGHWFQTEQRISFWKIRNVGKTLITQSFKRIRIPSPRFGSNQTID
jgi:hypothetical protein